MQSRFRRVVAFALLLALGCAAAAAAAGTQPLPRMVDVGAHKCIPCKKMAPIIEALQHDYAGVVEVVFVDVWKDPAAGKPYKVRMIPTQVFYGADGVEVFRHEGYFSREEIEAVFRDKLGVTPIAPAKEEG
jgi:thioredoxin 1